MVLLLQREQKLERIVIYHIKSRLVVVYPFPLAENNDELIQNIERFDAQEYSTLLKRFHEKVGVVLNPESSAMCAKLVEDYFKTGCDKKEFFEEYRNLLK